MPKEQATGAAANQKKSTHTTLLLAAFPNKYVRNRAFPFSQAALLPETLLPLNYTFPR